MTGILHAGQGVKFTGGTIAQATAVLHTNNILYFRGGPSGLYLQNGDGSDGYYISPTYHKWEVNSSESMRLTSTGLGIGTTAPDSKLNINGNSGDPSATYTTTATNSTISIGDFGASGLRMLFGVNPSTPSTWIQNQYTTNQVTAKLLLNPLGGNVGIGTTNPQTKIPYTYCRISCGCSVCRRRIPAISVNI